VDQFLTQDALTMALNQLQPPKGLIHHSDQGAEYTNHDYQSLIKEYNMVVNMSRSGAATMLLLRAFLSQSKPNLLRNRNLKYPKKRDQQFLNISRSFIIERDFIQRWVCQPTRL